MKKICLVIPCFQNELNIPHTGKEIVRLYESLRSKFDVCITMVDDGSSDQTYREIINFQSQNPSFIKSIKLARNFGSSAAVMAGLSHTDADVYAFMSADLQDPPELIPQMIEFWEKGLKVVVAARHRRPEKGLQKLLSNTFHYLMLKYAIPHAPKGGFDLLLFDRQVRDQLLEIDEPNLYLPYAVTWFGYASAFIPYERRQREHGTSSWTLSKKVKAFIDSFVAFSFMPIRLISSIGFVYAFFAVIYSLLIVVNRFTSDHPVEGWSSLMVVFVMTSALIFIALGILGEYLWRVLEVSRGRPSYVVERIIEEKKNV